MFQQKLSTFCSSFFFLLGGGGGGLCYLGSMLVSFFFLGGGFAGVVAGCLRGGAHCLTDGQDISGNRTEAIPSCPKRETFGWPTSSQA